MAEEELVVAESTLPTDLKRKHEDLEPDAPEPLTADSGANANSNSNSNGKESESVKKDEEEAASGDGSEESEPKRPRLLEKNDGLVTENGFQAVKEADDVKEADELPSTGNIAELEDAHQRVEEYPEAVNSELPSTDDNQTGDIEKSCLDNSQLESGQQKPSRGDFTEHSEEASQLGDVFNVEQLPASDTQTVSRRMEVPNNKVGVLIGKAGETIRLLQINSGAKIQITRDAEADSYSVTRPVELIGTLEQIDKAEKLIKDVIAEADAGGSPALVARGFSTIQAAGAAEQILIQVPNEKVGIIIGKGGETIKNLQTRSGARIQLIPQHLPEGDQSKDRTVRVSGDKKQIEMAREMIKEVMDQPTRPSVSGGYTQKVFRPRGPAAPQQWGHQGHHAQPTGYDYQQRGPYPSQNSQYPLYGNYPAQQAASRSGFGPGWEQRPSSTMQGPRPQSGSYDYYGGQGHMVDASASVPISNPVSAHGPSSATLGPPHSQGNYNYGQQHGPEYGQPASYPQTGPSPQGYGHGYNEAKYENQAPSHHPYGGHGGSQPGAYHQGTPGYAPQDQYGNKPTSYGMPPSIPPTQPYGQPRPSQPGDAPYQGPISSNQPYGQNAPVQQTYPYMSSGPVQQIYSPYGSAPAADGYNQQQPATGSAQVYPHQGGLQVSSYGQPGGQQAAGYAQVVPPGGYGSYPTSQPGYAAQPAQNTAGYGYPGVDPAYGSAPGSAYGAPTGQAGYAQPVPTQATVGYDQSVPHSGGQGTVPGVVPQAVYPQQYDSTQMYAAPR